MRGWLTIEYEDKTYKGISIIINEDWDNPTLFDSGNITVDFVDFIKWLGTQKNMNVSYSSSWDHFFMDEKNYKGLHILHDGWDNIVIDDPFDSRFEQALEYPVLKEINTFKELKEYYDTHKINEV